MKTKNGYLDGAKKSVPIVIGYIPVAITFGILCKTQGLSLFHAFLSSFVLYSGAAQFLLVDFLVSGVSLLGIAISIFLLNTRLFIMSASLGTVIDKIDRKTFPIVGWWDTDETFSVISFNRDIVSTQFVLGLQFPTYLAWGIPTIVGYIIGDFLPKSIEISMSLGLLGLFIALLIPNVKKHKESILVVAVTSIIYGSIFYLKIFTNGWDIVISIIISSVLGVFLIGKKSKIADS